MSVGLWLLELNTEFPVDPITVGTEKKKLVSPPPRSQENAISKARKIFYNKYIYHVCTSCYPYFILLNFVSFLHKSQQIFFFFEKKQQNLGKNQKNHNYFELIVQL